MLDYMWEATKLAQKYAVANQQTSWSFRKGTEIYWNPDFRCPHCNLTFPTKRVWWIDEFNQKLLGCWYIENPVDGQLRPVGNTGAEVVHPHVDHYGKPCMGSAKSVSQLLFNGIAPGRHHRHTDMWLLSVGHDCPKLPKTNCMYCDQEFPTVKAHLYGHRLLCSERCVELASNSFCAGCYISLLEGREARHENYCPECFTASAKVCSHCGQAHLPHNTKLINIYTRICLTCLANESGLCRSCAQRHPYSVLIKDKGRCEGCRLVACCTCGDVYKRSELDAENHCPECARGLARITTAYTLTSESGTHTAEVQSCNVSIESSLQALEDWATGSSGVSAETLPDLELHLRSTTPTISEEGLVIEDFQSSPDQR